MTDVLHMLKPCGYSSALTLHDLSAAFQAVEQSLEHFLYLASGFLDFLSLRPSSAFFLISSLFTCAGPGLGNLDLSFYIHLLSRSIVLYAIDILMSVSMPLP